jgi:Uma2 family endonuclease
VVARSETPAAGAGRLDRQRAAAHLTLEPPRPMRGHEPRGDVARIELGAGVRLVRSLRGLEASDPARAATKLGPRELGAADVVARHFELGHRLVAQEAPRRLQRCDLRGGDDAREATVGRERTVGDLGRDLEAHALPRRGRRLLAEDPLDELVGTTHAREPTGRLRPDAANDARRMLRSGSMLAQQPYPASWYIEDDEKVPQSSEHRLRALRLDALFQGWKARTGRDVLVGGELALRWDEAEPRAGVDPDVYIVEPPPPEGAKVTSLRTWEPGHHPPLLAVEIVGPSNAGKDYSPKRYAASGTRELWIFDPELAGPKATGGPFRIQVWRRDDAGTFARVYTGEGPVFSPAIGGWLFAVDGGQALAIADDEAGTRWWLTPEESERARANRMAEKLRELGIDPASIG